MRKENITNKIGDNSLCPCGSSIKYKKCCKPYMRVGPLLKKMNEDFNDLHTIFIFEIGGILNNLCIKTENHNVVYEAIIDLFSSSEKALSSIKNHTYTLKNDAGVHKNENTWVVEDFDHELKFYIRDIFIKGRIVIDSLIRLSNDLGFNISFLFKKEDDKDFNKKLYKLTSSFADTKEGSRLKEFIQDEQNNWLKEFLEARDGIEHGIFKINSIEYPVNKFNKLVPQYPKILNKNINELFNLYRIKIFYFSREILIFLLGERASKLNFPDNSKGALILVRDDDMPWGEGNLIKDKKIFKLGLVNNDTREVVTTNFSQSCSVSKF